MNGKTMPGLRSDWEFGEASECRKGLMCGMGYTAEEQRKPLIGVVNSWNEYNPGHVHLDKLAARVKDGIREAGGLPVEVMTTAVCDGMVMKDPRYIEVPSRNLIADQVELTAESNMFDGMVLLSTCDSIVPGHLMGAARCNIPSLLVTGGYMPLGTCRGREVLHIHAQDKVGAMAKGEMDPALYEDLIENSWAPSGACTSMTTAKSMCMVSEALGMSLPGNATMDASGSRLLRLAYEAGKTIMGLVKNGVRARDIMTESAFRNAIKMDMAVAGSSNLFLHIPAIANEAGLDRPWWKEFDLASHEIPLLSSLAPGGPYSLRELDLAGGMPGLMRSLLPALDAEARTVTGKTLRELYEHAPVYDSEVIRTLDRPVSKDPGLGVLYGNLAPEGSILKIAAVPDSLRYFRGKARIFNSLDEGLQALRNGEVHPGDACVLRFLGLKARFGTTAFPFQEELKGQKALYQSCAVITDGRFSGGTSGLSVGYVSPEAALGGPLGLLKEGDEIEIDVENRRISVLLSDEELAERKAAFHWEFPFDDYPRFLRLFAKNVGSMAKGGIWE